MPEPNYRDFQDDLEQSMIQFAADDLNSQNKSYSRMSRYGSEINELNITSSKLHMQQDFEAPDYHNKDKGGAGAL